MFSRRQLVTAEALNEGLADKATIGALAALEEAMTAALANLAGAFIFKGDWSAAGGTFPGAGAAEAAWVYKVSVAGTVDGVIFSVGDELTALVDNASATVYAANWLKSEGTVTVADITDASANGRSLITAVNFAAMKTLLTLVKGDVGLGNVDNTADTDKPVSTAQQTALNLKANLASPTFTGTPAGPTASPGTNTTQFASTAFVQAALAALVASSPAALDTLNELATALGNDAAFSTTVTNALAAKAPLASPALTGNPTAPTQTAGDNSTKISTTAYVDAAVVAAAPLAPGFLFGLTLSNNVSDATNDIDIAAGSARDTTNTANMVLAAGITKRLDAAWAVGSGNGGLDQGSIANATYHIHQIKRPDTGVVDAIFSLSHDGSAVVTMTIASPCVVTWGVAGKGHGLVAGSPFKFSTTGALPTGVTAGTQYYVIATGLTETTFQFSATNGGAAINSSGSQSGVHTGLAGPQLPTNYTQFRRIGSIIRAGAAIRAFRQLGDSFLLAAPVIDVDTAVLTTSRMLCALSVPVGINVRAHIKGAASKAATTIIINIQSPYETDGAPDTATTPGASAIAGSSGGNGGYETDVWTDTSGQIAARSAQSGTTFRVATTGWLDTRGRLA